MAKTEKFARTEVEADAMVEANNSRSTRSGGNSTHNNNSTGSTGVPEV